MNLCKFYKYEKLKILYFSFRNVWWFDENQIGVENDFNKFYKFW